MTGLKRNSWSGGAALLLWMGMLGGCHGAPVVERAHAEAPQAHGKAQPVDVSTVAAPGVVESWGGEVRLSSREAGWIAEVRVTEGQVVAGGDLLVRLDDTEQLSAVADAQAQVRETAAALARLARGATAQEEEEARSEAAALDARAQLARADGERAQRLHDGGALTRADYERAVAESAALENAAAAASARYEQVAGSARPEDLAAAEARLASARARLAQAESALARRSVTAPSAGTVLWSRVRPGEYYTPGAQPLLLMGDVSRLQVRLEVNEDDAARIVAGNHAVLYSDAGDSIAAGTVFRVAPSIGRRGIRSESPTDRQDLRIREVFVGVSSSAALSPGQRVWAYVRPAAES